MAYLAPIVGPRHIAILLAAIVVASLAACGGGDDASEGVACAESGEPNAKGELTIIAAETKEAGDVIADAACQPLYVNDVDTAQKITCVGECARVWIPVTVPAKGAVRAETPAQIGQIELVKRPDGDTQAVLNDQPLYRFSGDQDAGATDGEGVSDSFGGVDYEWSVLTLDEAASNASAGFQTPGSQGPVPGARTSQGPKGPRN